MLTKISSNSKVFFNQERGGKWLLGIKSCSRRHWKREKNQLAVGIFSIILKYVWNITSAPLGMEGAEHVSLSSLGCPNRAAGNSALEPSVSDPFPDPAASRRTCLWSCSELLPAAEAETPGPAGGWEWEMQFVHSPALGEAEALTAGRWALNIDQRPRAEWGMMEPKLRETMQYKDWAHPTDKNKEFGTGES